MSEAVLEQAPEEPKKRTFREIARNYRRLGLPNAKKLRQATKMQTLQRMNEFYLDMLKEAAKLNVQANNIIRDLIKESNFAVRGEVGEVLWVEGDAPIQNAKKYLESLSAGRPVAARQSQSQPPIETAHA